MHPLVPSVLPGAAHRPAGRGQEMAPSAVEKGLVLVEDNCGGALLMVDPSMMMAAVLIGPDFDPDSVRVGLHGPLISPAIEPLPAHPERIAHSPQAGVSGGKILRVSLKSPARFPPRGRGLLHVLLHNVS